MFPTFDARESRYDIVRGDGDTSIMELEAAGEDSEDRLVLEERELYADADSGTFGECGEAAPAAAHLGRGGDTALSRCAVLGFGGIAAPDKPACGAEDVAVAIDGFVTVDANQRNMDDLALLDRDRLDPRTVSTADRVAEGDHIVLFSELLGTVRRREHAQGLLAHGIEVGEAVRVHQVVVRRFASDGPEFLAKLGLDVRVLCKRPCGESKRQGCRLVADKTEDKKSRMAQQQQKLSTYRNVRK